MRLFIRAWKVALGLSSRLISLFERKNPEALLEFERENFRKIVGRFNEGLVAHATLVERLKGQTSSDEAKVAELGGKMRALVRAGETASAARYALQLKQLTTTLAADTGKLEAAEAKYQQLVLARDKAVADTRGKLDQLRWQIGDLKVNRAMADLESMAAAMVGGISEPGDGINRLTEMVAEENERAKARSRVAATDGGTVDFARSQVEEEALAAQALEEFLANEPQAPRLAIPNFSERIDFNLAPKKH
ncbi:MAG: hypothetical protein U1E67_18850 [Hyphomicrobiales bacterium]